MDRRHRLDLAKRAATNGIPQRLHCSSSSSGTVRSNGITSTSWLLTLPVTSMLTSSNLCIQKETVTVPCNGLDAAAVCSLFRVVITACMHTCVTLPAGGKGFFLVRIFQIYQTLPHCRTLDLQSRNCSPAKNRGDSLVVGSGLPVGNNCKRLPVH